jgi:hypothetical protein
VVVDMMVLDSSYWVTAIGSVQVVAVILYDFFGICVACLPLVPLGACVSEHAGRRFLSTSWKVREECVLGTLASCDLRSV